MSSGVKAGIRTAAPVGLAVFFVGISFGIVARPVMGQVAPVVMSLIVYAGSAQFAAPAVLLDGGSALTAIAAGILLNLRFVRWGSRWRPRCREASCAALSRVRRWWTPRGRSPTSAAAAAFFAILLLDELRDRRSQTVAVCAAIVALALTPVAPPGVPVLAAAALLRRVPEPAATPAP